MSDEKKTETSNNALDNLLDEALQDFDKPIPNKTPTNIPPADEKSSSATNDVWTEEFIQQATKQFETNIRQMMQQQTETVPDNGSCTNSLQQDPTTLPENTLKSAEIPPNTFNTEDFSACLSNTMEQLMKNTAEAQAPPSAGDMEKMFQNLGFGDESNTAAGGFFPLMQTVMENILSKDVLYPPVKEIVTKYPDWLADNRPTLSEEDFSRYNKQYDIMKQVTDVFESEKDDDTEEEKAKKFEEVLQLMQKLQDLGQPPKDLVGDFGPTLNFDKDGNPMMPDVNSLLGAAGFLTNPFPDSAQGQPEGVDAPEACALM